MKISLAYPFVFILFLLACNGSSDSTFDPESNLNEVTTLRRMIQKYPDSLLLREQLIQLYRDSGNYTAAIKDCDSLINRFPGYFKAWSIRSKLQFEKGDSLAALPSMERAVILLPSKENLIELGSLMAVLKDERTPAVAEKLMTGTPSARKDGLLIKGIYYNNIEKYDSAIAFLEECLQLSYTNMNAYREKSIALYGQGKYNEALETLNIAITLQNAFSEGYYYSGKCLEKLNRKEEARIAYETALVLEDNDYPEASEAIAKLNTSHKK
jgi:tetratricopeptide (TPR) repeat protein